MKATCYNCKNYVDTLVNPANPEIHIHDWCRQWQRQLDPFALAGQFEYNGNFSNDLETGDAFCYLFSPAEVPAKPDAWFAANKQENLERMIDA